MMIKIDKGVPMVGQRTVKKLLQYPWDKMEIGDSFLVRDKLISYASRLAFDAKYQYKPKLFSCRTVEGGVRIWRVL